MSDYCRYPFSGVTKGCVVRLAAVVSHDTQAGKKISAEDAGLFKLDMKHIAG